MRKHNWLASLFDAGINLCRARHVCYLDMGGDAPAAPDYTPMADASKESAEIMAKLGNDQLDFAKQQYEENKPIAQQIVDSQLRISDETARQGKDYYDYMAAKQRPVEDALNAEAMAAGSEGLQEEAANKAVADVRQGTTQQQNQIIRQGIRYGYTPEKMTATGGAVANANGLALASAANGAREKEKQIGFAKKLDVAGLYRGLPGASQGAYGVAVGAGNSANANQAQPGNNAMNGMATGSATIGQGRSLVQQGLGSVLNSQTSVYGAGADSGGGMMSGIGSLMGGAAAAYTAFSDRRLKDDIVPTGEMVNGLMLYEFNYIGESARYIGVMADEVELLVPEAVITNEDGFKMVNYEMLGFRMKEA